MSKVPCRVPFHVLVIAHREFKILVIIIPPRLLLAGLMATAVVPIELEGSMVLIAPSAVRRNPCITWLAS